MNRTTKVVGLAGLVLLAYALLRWAGGLARSWADIWEHYHREVLAGYDALDALDGDDFDHWDPAYDHGPPDTGLGDQVGSSINDRLAADFDQLARRLAADTPRPRLIWPVDDPGRPRFEHPDRKDT